MCKILDNDKSLEMCVWREGGRKGGREEGRKVVEGRKERGECHPARTP